MKSLFGRNINILRGSKASVLSKQNFSAGPLSLLNTRPSAKFLFNFCLCTCTSICLFYGLLIINPLFENLL